MDYEYEILWTKEAIENLETIIIYIRNKWTEREVNDFKSKLKHHLNLIQRNPNLFPVSTAINGVRKSVLTKQTIIFYSIENRKVYILHIFNTYQSQNRLK